MAILRNWEIEKQVWEANPALKYALSNIPHTEETSNLVWAFALYYCPDSDYAQSSKEDKILLIRNFLDDETWHPELEEWKNEKFSTWNKYLNNNFPNLVLSRAERNLLIWGDKFDERTQFLKDTPYNAETIDMLEKLMANTAKVRDQYLKALQEARAEQEAETFGAIMESASDSKKL